MTVRRVLIPCGKWVSLSAYVSRWKLLKTLPPETEVCGWEWFPMTAAEILRDFSRGCEDRLNAGVPRSQIGVSK